MCINQRERNKQRVSKRIEVQHDGPGLPIVINPNTLEDGKTVELRAAEILARRVTSSEDVMVKVERSNVMVQNMSLYYAKITDGSRERTLRLWF
jgi:hypothetical protein